jgi:hypothetical protein
MFHEVIAAIGGSLFIAFGVARKRETRELMIAGIKSESPLLGQMLVVSGLCLVVFAFGLIIYQMS